MIATEPGFAAQLAEDLSPGDLRHVLSVFRADVQRLAEVLRVTAMSGDIVGFRRVAHSLAGAAGAVGAQALEQACRLAMTRADIGPAQAMAVQTGIATLCEAALADMAAFIAELDRNNA